MRNILITSPTYSKFSSAPLNLLKSAGFEINWIKEATQEQILENIVNADAILVGLEQVTADILKKGTRLKVVAKHGAGIDNIDTKTAEELGIAVVNAPGANSDAVADFTIGLMVSVARSINVGSTQLKNKGWPKIIGQSLWEATIGIIGLGAIGRAVALRAKGFNMRVLAHDICWDEAFVEQNGIIKASLDEIYGQSDFITLHLALTEETKDLISMEQFKKMKKNAIVINAARGGLINEEDLYNAVKDGVIAGAGIDAFSQEPLGESPLLTLDNIVATPHLATYTKEALNNMSMIATKRILERFV